MEEILSFISQEFSKEKVDLPDHSHPDVGIIWNFYPFNWFVLPPIDWLLNIILFPITLLTWPLWVLWNLFTLPLAILFFPLWAIYMSF